MRIQGVIEGLHGKAYKMSRNGGKHGYDREGVGRDRDRGRGRGRGRASVCESTRNERIRPQKQPGFVLGLNNRRLLCTGTPGGTNTEMVLL